MTLKEMLILTGELPQRAVLANGIVVETDVQKNGKLGYIASLWQITGLDVKEHLIDYGTGSTPELAKRSLKNKLKK